MGSPDKSFNSIEQKFRNALAEESDFPLDDSLYNYITDNATTLIFQKGDAIVDFDSLDASLYVVKTGIVRGFMSNDGAEANIYFGMEGTVMASMQCFSCNKPSIMRIEACCYTEMLRIAKPTFDSMMDANPRFCRWIAGVFTRRSCYDELKAKVMNGDAKWRYEWLERCRPELFDNVPLKAIASYLKMTEVHVSRIRKSLAKRMKK